MSVPRWWLFNKKQIGQQFKSKSDLQNHILQLEDTATMPQELSTATVPVLIDFVFRHNTNRRDINDGVSTQPEVVADGVTEGVNNILKQLVEQNILTENEIQRLRDSGLSINEMKTMVKGSIEQQKAFAAIIGYASRNVAKGLVVAFRVNNYLKDRTDLIDTVNVDLKYDFVLDFVDHILFFMVQNTASTILLSKVNSILRRKKYRQLNDIRGGEAMEDGLLKLEEQCIVILTDAVEFQKQKKHKKREDRDRDEVEHKDIGEDKDNEDKDIDIVVVDKDIDIVVVDKDIDIVVVDKDKDDEVHGVHDGEKPKEKDKKKKNKKDKKDKKKKDKRTKKKKKKKKKPHGGSRRGMSVIITVLTPTQCAKKLGQNGVDKMIKWCEHMGVSLKDWAYTRGKAEEVNRLEALGVFGGSAEDVE